MATKKRYTVVKPFELPNGEKAGAGTSVELTPEQAKYLLYGGKIVEEAAQAAPQKKAAAQVAEAKGEKK